MRIGVVLVGAAMMDDVVGLVMVKIVTTLGSGNFAAWLIARPIVASFGLLLVTLVITPWILRQLVSTANTWLILILVAFVNTAALIDASVLLAAFIAGGLVKTLWHAPLSDSVTTVSTDLAADMYRTYYHPVVSYVLPPFLFVRLYIFCIEAQGLILFRHPSASPYPFAICQPKGIWRCSL